MHLGLHTDIQIHINRARHTVTVDDREIVDTPPMTDCTVPMDGYTPSSHAIEERPNPIQAILDIIAEQE